MSEHRKPLSLTLNVSVTPEMHQLLRDEADRVGWSVSHLVRKVLSTWADGIPDHHGSLGFVISDR